MSDRFYRSGGVSGFQYDSNKPITKNDMSDSVHKRKGKDDDLIIEENTVYEIDRDCYERLKRQKKKKE
jgi:hypothetical protein